MIDQSKRYWTGDCPEDIDRWLRLYTGEEGLEVKPVVCHSCGGDVFRARVDRQESVIEAVCAGCGTKKLLLDCGEYYEDARPRLQSCRVCKTGKTYNLRVGFLRREEGSIRWVYIGERCTECGTLGSFLDWKVDYSPTDEMEKNL